ncbi:Phosphotyrosyl phosphatase activator [Sodiomyces alkalinus F11]|uniref:Serine/threonine-protein phosphatase 2A activator n=1 Tax=Sodiomyces alkalinus (strain CBS 110278 / VKM F-3762 / F11) TaxID=1314773 RepID=A0A3N2PJV0_SODAK|nr:Phosphotyrosyl phosphatase activator [Sodiomyces alkalinus F11]ROT34801.1 Phosphotyrosyl phosphatase activator [Sodiomyces alkalinus F11]
MSSSIVYTHPLVEPAPDTATSLVPMAQIPKLAPHRRRSAQTSPFPRPETPALPTPPVPSPLMFMKPSRRIISPQDHELFLDSSAYRMVVAFVFSLSDSVRDTPCSAVNNSNSSGNVRNIIEILDRVEELLKRSPPVEQGGSRFGNKAYRGFVDLVETEASEWHAKLGIDDSAARDELSAYFIQSFGSRERIDYGSGHELNFIIWLLCLYQLRTVAPPDFAALVLSVFKRYLELMRKIQLSYYLEPAGSHGVWGLDDYQFLPFLFGASQLLHHPYITPLAIHQELTIEEFAPDYLYLNQVAFVNSTKTVKGLRWHSPLLDDISSAKSWYKIEGGMRRMFVAEVLGKLSVMQHFLFGSLVPAADGMTEGPVASYLAQGAVSGEPSAADLGTRQQHHHVGWGDCCGIKVPSSVAAVQELRKKEGSAALRRIPFD